MKASVWLARKKATRQLCHEAGSTVGNKFRSSLLLLSHSPQAAPYTRNSLIIDICQSAIVSHKRATMEFLLL